jgi:hypothetical protein
MRQNDHGHKTQNMMISHASCRPKGVGSKASKNATVLVSFITFQFSYTREIGLTHLSHSIMSEFATESSTTDCPPTQLLLRERNGLQGFNGPPSVIPIERDPLDVSINTIGIFKDVKKARIAPVYSPNGSLLCIVPDAGQNISLYSTLSGEQVVEIVCKEAAVVEFSPLGTYLITWSRAAPTASPAATEDGGPSTSSNLGNLQVCQLIRSRRLRHCRHLESAVMATCVFLFVLFMLFMYDTDGNQ